MSLILWIVIVALLAGALLLAVFAISAKKVGEELDDERGTNDAPTLQQIQDALDEERK